MESVYDFKLRKSLEEYLDAISMPSKFDILKYKNKTLPGNPYVKQLIDELPPTIKDNSLINAQPIRALPESDLPNKQGVTRGFELALQGSSPYINKMQSGEIILKRDQKLDVPASPAYVLAHELGHRFASAGAPYELTEGNKGYMPVQSFTQWPPTPSQMEGWLTNYPERERPAERFAEKFALSPYGYLDEGFYDKYPYLKPKQKGTIIKKRK